MGEVVRDDNSTGLTAPDVARRLEQTAERLLADQMQRLVNIGPEPMLDDVLLVGCEVTPT